MEKQNEHFRHILLFYFCKGKSASKAHKKLCAVYGDEALKERQCQNWFHQKKVMLSVWWDCKGIVYFEILPCNQTINSDVYIEQLTKLNNAIQEKRPELINRKGIVFHHNNPPDPTYLYRPI